MSVYNVSTKRNVIINGPQYKKYINQGYYVSHSQLLPPIKPQSPIEKVFESTIINNIVKELEPNDLLSLSLTNKDNINQILNNKKHLII